MCAKKYSGTIIILPISKNPKNRANTGIGYYLLSANLKPMRNPKNRANTGIGYYLLSANLKPMRNPFQCDLNPKPFAM